MEPQAEQIIKRAAWDLNLREMPWGSNNGGRLREVLKETEFKPGDPWCMYWVVAVMIDVFKGKNNLPQSVLYTGSCQAAAEHAAELNKLSRSAATGCIFVLMNTAGHFHHAGFVTAVDVYNGIIHTIEGNTNDNGSTEGYGVFYHKRNMSPLIRYIIW